MDRARESTPVAILWDFENCPVPSTSRSSPEPVVMELNKYASLFGTVKHFATYACHVRLPDTLRRSLLQCGVSTIDVPSTSKNAADMMLLSDMMAFVLDNRPPCTILLISGDSDFACALHKLVQRRYNVVVVCNDKHLTRDALQQCSSERCMDWKEFLEPLLTSRQKAHMVSEPPSPYARKSLSPFAQRSTTKSAQTTTLLLKDSTEETSIITANKAPESFVQALVDVVESLPLSLGDLHEKFVQNQVSTLPSTPQQLLVLISKYAAHDPRIEFRDNMVDILNGDAARFVLLSLDVARSQRIYPLQDFVFSMASMASNYTLKAKDISKLVHDGVFPFEKRLLSCHYVPGAKGAMQYMMFRKNLDYSYVDWNETRNIYTVEQWCLFLESLQKCRSEDLVLQPQSPHILCAQALRSCGLLPLCLGNILNMIEISLRSGLIGSGAPCRGGSFHQIVLGFNSSQVSLPPPPPPLPSPQSSSRALYLDLRFQLSNLLEHHHCGIRLSRVPLLLKDVGTPQQFGCGSWSQLLRTLPDVCRLAGSMGFLTVFSANHLYDNQGNLIISSAE